jgi:hypothetical protein
MSKTRSNMTDDDPQHGHSFDAGSGAGQVAIAYLISKFSSRSPSVTCNQVTKGQHGLGAFRAVWGSLGQYGAANGRGSRHGAGIAGNRQRTPTVEDFVEAVGGHYSGLAKTVSTQTVYNQ